MRKSVVIVAHYCVNSSSHTVTHALRQRNIRANDCHSHTHHSLKHILSHTHTLSLTYIHTLSLTHTHSHTLIYTHSFTHTLIHTHIIHSTHTLSLTYTHSHTLIHTLTHSTQVTMSSITSSCTNSTWPRMNSCADRLRNTCVRRSFDQSECAFKYEWTNQNTF